MKPRSLLAGVAAGVLAFAPALGTLHAAPHHKMAHKRAASAPPSQIGALGAVPVLPTNAPPFNAAAAAQSQPFAQTTTPPCVTLTNQTWIANPNTQLCGLLSKYNNNVTAYQGIQYATAERWQAPTPYKLPASPTNLTAFGPACPQQPPNPPKPGISENCLYLNVWVPPSGSGTNLPVMVYIHGGAFITGEGSSPWYDGTAFAMNKVILVTLNYRLGALGFLDCPSSCNQYGVNATGNYGIMDQQMALQWVQDNIAAFGGDPGKVTIFGESAGAMSVGLHLFSIPSSTKLFSAAIMESNPLGLVYQPAAAAGPTTIGNQFLMALCSSISPTLCTQKNLSDPSVTPLPTLLAVQTLFMSITSTYEILVPVPNGVYDAAYGYIGVRGLPWQPVIDGTLIPGPGQPYQGYVSGTVPKPVVFGINKDEGVVFAASVAATYNPPSSGPSQSAYAALADCGFQSNLSDCGDFADPLASATNRYSPTAPPPNYQPGNAYYNNYGQAGANIVTDYDFAIGNIVMANKAYTQNQRQKYPPPIYAYYFSQPPLWDVYQTDHNPPPDNNACGPSPGGGNFVCHAAELPYVFNTLAIVDPTTPPPPPPANLQLASAMNAAWAAFAANPAKPGSPWTSYANTNNNNTSGTPAVIFNTSNLPPSATGPIDPNGVYSIWWNSCYNVSPPAASCAAPGAVHEALRRKKAKAVR